MSGTGGVKEDLRARIVETALALGYVNPTSAIGRRIILATSSVAMIDHARNQFTFHVLDGLKERADALGIELVTRTVANAEDEAHLLAESEADPSVAGCLFLTLDDALVLARSEGFSKPIVLVNGDDPSMRHSSVTPCNRSAARLAATHLLELGHRRILFLMHSGRRTIERRFEGWRDALRDCGLEDIDDLVVTVDDWLPELASRAIAGRLGKGTPDFTAVLAAGDSLAYGAMLAIKQAGYSVPEDFSVVGMDDLPLSGFSDPPLTTMHIPMRHLGAAAISLLLDDLGVTRLPARRVELACWLTERASTGPVRRHGLKQAPRPSQTG